MTRLASLATLAAVAATLLAPSSAHALLAGAESNRELVNTTQTPALQAEALDKMKAQGVKVVRANFRWYEIASACGGQSAAALENPNHPCYNWGIVDGMVRQANDRGMQALASFQQNPTWVGSPASNPFFMGSGETQFRNIVTHYAAFYKAAATRYAAGSIHGTISYMTIHNEPNSARFWGSAPNPQRYAYLYAKTAVKIRQANKAVRLAPGPLGPTGGGKGMKPLDFLPTFQKYVTAYLPGTMAAKRSYINAFAHNPYPAFNQGPSYQNSRAHAKWITMGTIDRLTKQLDRYPVTKGTSVWATEFGWETPPEFPFSTSPARQAQFMAEAYHWLDSKKRVTIAIWYGLSDPKEIPDFQSGTFTNAGAPKLSHFMFQRMISVPKAGLSNRVKRGTVLAIWGRSNLAPTKGVIAYRIIGKKCRATAKINEYCVLAGQKRRNSDGSINGALRPMVRGTYDFVVYDGTVGYVGDNGYGKTRRVAVL